MTKGLVYYTDLTAPLNILRAVQVQIRRAAREIPMVVVSCESRIIDFEPDDEWMGTTWYVVRSEPRGYLTMFRQILAGLEALETDIAFLCEHDVLYHPSHFEFTPPYEDAYYYNLNWWKVDATTGRALTYEAKQTAFLCAHRALLIEHYRKRIARVDAEGFSRKMGFEPGSHHRPERVDDVRSEIWRSAVPNIDIRHGHNLTESRWSPFQFRTPPVGWQESDAVPGWGTTKGRFRAFLADVSRAEVPA